MDEPHRLRNWPGYALASGAVLACTLAGLAMQPRFDIVNIAMVYLLGVVIVALRFSRGAAIFSAVVSVAVFDFTFVPPAGAFTVNDAQYLLTFTIMLIVALVISNLTERARRENAARAALIIQAETERMRSTLLASISHDLRTPLAVMAGASSSLVLGGERMNAAQRTKLAENIYGKARELSERVDKLLQMTRLEMGPIALARDWVSIGEIVGTVLGRLNERLSAHKVLIDLPDDLPLVHLDPALIDQMFGNLLENAATHTPAGTIVRVRAEVSRGELRFDVEDFGPGLDDRDIERVFDKFYREGRDGNGAGVGLGLAICRAIITLHGGRIWAERNPDGGTIFRFTVPRSQVPALPGAQDASENG